VDSSKEYTCCRLLIQRVSVTRNTKRRMVGWISQGYQQNTALQHIIRIVRYPHNKVGQGKKLRGKGSPKHAKELEKNTTHIMLGVLQKPPATQTYIYAEHLDQTHTESLVFASVSELSGARPCWLHLLKLIAVRILW